jgi:hypothetical protein
MREIDARRSEWTDGHPYILADGQVWNVPVPSPRLRAAGQEGIYWAIAGERWELEVLEAWARIINAAEHPAEGRRLAEVLAARLLLANYDLPFDDALALVAGPVAAEIAEEFVIDVKAGVARMQDRLDDIKNGLN